MSGSFEKLDVPPTLISFAVTTDKCENVISPEFKRRGSKVVMLAPEYDDAGLPKKESLLALFDKVTSLMREGKVLAAYTPTAGGVAEAVMKMAMGNGFGFDFDSGMCPSCIFGYKYGAFVLELAEDIDLGKTVGYVTDRAEITFNGEKLNTGSLFGAYEDKLESVYSCNIESPVAEVKTVSYEAKTRVAPAIKCAKPRVLIPVFPGTNCEFDTAKVMRDAGAEAKIFVINNMTQDGIQRSVESFAKELSDSQMVFVPGGFSGGDEPDGSGKFIMAFFRNAQIKDGVHDLLNNRDGLMCGICNGFQALTAISWNTACA